MDGGTPRPKIRSCSIIDPYVLISREDDTIGLFIDTDRGKIRRKDMSPMGDKVGRPHPYCTIADDVVDVQIPGWLLLYRSQWSVQGRAAVCIGASNNYYPGRDGSRYANAVARARTSSRRSRDMVLAQIATSVLDGRVQSIGNCCYRFTCTRIYLDSSAGATKTAAGNGYRADIGRAAG